MMRTRNVFLSLLSVVAALVVLALLPAGVFAASHQAAGAAAMLHRGMWNIVPSPNPGSAPALSGVAALSPKNAWAVGSTTNSQLNAGVTLAEHWNGTNWQVVKSPNSGTSAFASVAAISANDMWAVGTSTSSAGFTQTLTEHWNGTSWQVVKSPNVGAGANFLFGVAAISTGDVWAVGIFFNGSTQQTLIEHWNGTSWQVVKSPNVGAGANFLNGVAAVSARDVWAVGNSQSTLSSPFQTLIEHWNGSSWQVVKSPSIGTSGDLLNGIAVVSASNAWAVGDFVNSANASAQTLIEHWNGTSWQVVKSPDVGTGGNILNGITVLSASNAWAVGDFVNSVNASSQTLTEHWNGTSWQVVKSPNVGNVDNILSSVAGVPGTGNVWTVGNLNFGEGGSQTLTEFFS